TEHYVTLSDEIIEHGGQGISEHDNLEGSRKSLRSGYAQSKWVSEKLVLEARRRGLPATIVRPGYIVGDSRTGVTNTDDFIWRLIKGCIQLGLIPTIHNTINMCPVDYVADCVAQISLLPTSPQKGVFHITHPSNPSFRFDDLFQSLTIYGYSVQRTEYIVWRNKLMEFILQAQDNALYPLLHFVLDDLPTSTKSPELDDSNTRAAVSRTPICIDEQLMGVYLGYLVGVGFLSRPETGGRELPVVVVDAEILKRSGRN
ncbi:12961_t:CDS:2, partial [Ambispora leptoticha]